VVVVPIQEKKAGVGRGVRLGAVCCQNSSPSPQGPFLPTLGGGYQITGSYKSSRPKKICKMITHMDPLWNSSTRRRLMGWIK